MKDKKSPGSDGLPAVLYIYIYIYIYIDVSFPVALLKLTRD